jgi:hypothetical protein
VKDLLYGYNDELLTTVASFLPVFADKAFVRLIPSTAPPDTAEADAQEPTVMATGALNSVTCGGRRLYAFHQDEVLLEQTFAVPRSSQRQSCTIPALASERQKQ